MKAETVVVLGQLYVLRAQVDVLIRMLEGDPEAPTGCPHPEEKRLDTTTAGGPRKFICGVCDEEVEGIA